jgi:hypothetical protein
MNIIRQLREDWPLLWWETKVALAISGLAACFAIVAVLFAIWIRWNI